jgi:hypothetical protein
MLTGKLNLSDVAVCPGLVATDVKHVVVEQSGHWIHLDLPDLVAAEVRQMLVLSR